MRNKFNPNAELAKEVSQGVARSIAKLEIENSKEQKSVDPSSLVHGLVMRIETDRAITFKRPYLAYGGGGFVEGEGAPHFASEHFNEIYSILKSNVRERKGVIVSSRDYEVANGRFENRNVYVESGNQRSYMELEYRFEEKGQGQVTSAQLYFRTSGISKEDFIRIARIVKRADFFQAPGLGPSYAITFTEEDGTINLEQKVFTLTDLF